MSTIETKVSEQNKSSFNTEKQFQPLDTWKALVAYFATGGSGMVDIETKAVIADIYKDVHNSEFEEQKSTMTKGIIYNLWEEMFYAPELFKYEFELQGLTKQQKEFVVAKKTNIRKYIGSFTDYVLTVYRNEITINDRFVAKLFEHDLEKILVFILENEKFFSISVSTEKLSDLYIILACDMGNFKIFSKMLPYVNIYHFEYAVRFATLDFLMMMWKMRRWLPKFDENMRILQNNMEKKEWKQLQFFDWWMKHLPLPG